jgi:hypothetical protein
MTTTAEVPAELATYEPESPAGHRPPRHRGTTVGPVLRYTIAGLMLGAAGIHFAMMGEHAGMSWTHGTFFAVIAWLQVGVAATILLRPSRSVALACIGINIATLAVWVLTRTVGIAIGGDGAPEAWGRVDAVCAVFEGLAVVAAMLLLSTRVSRRPISVEVGAAGAAFVAVVVAAVTALVFSPAFASGAGTSADGHDHGGATVASAAGGHTHGAPVDDKGLALLHNGHHAEIGPEQPLSGADRTELSRQMAATIEVARRMPTPKEALAAGYHQTGPYMPGIGAHFIKIGGASLNGDGVLDDADLQEPLAIIYDGVASDSRVAGFMYYSTSKTAPRGFAGPNDHWHFHTSLCLKYGPGGAIDLPYGFDVKIPKAQCDALGGTLLQQSQWMVHVWSVPGWESGQGLFGEVNPALACPDGSYYQLPMSKWLDHPDNVCRSAI